MSFVDHFGNKKKRSDDEYDRFVTVTVKNAKLASRTFIESLDRTPLGDFALDAEILIISDAYERMVNKRYTSGAMSDATGVLKREFHNTIKDGRIFRADIFAELNYWWSQSGETDLVEYSNGYLYHKDTYDKFKLIIGHGLEYHPYFHADIWDVEFIAECLANDIDSELAVSMMSGK